MGNPYPAAFDDELGIGRLEGELTFTDVANQPGGSTLGAAILRGPFSFAFDDAGLEDGLEFSTPTVGDIILDVFVVVDIAFDGTTPKLDYGTGVGTNTGLLNAFTGISFASGADDERGGTGLLIGGSSTNSPTSLAASGGYYGIGHPEGIVTAANPLKVWVSQDGQKGGAAAGSTAGAARLYIVTATPVAL